MGLLYLLVGMTQTCVQLMSLTNLHTHERNLSRNSEYFPNTRNKISVGHRKWQKHMRRISLSFTAVLRTVLSHINLHPPGYPVTAAMLKVPRIRNALYK